MTPEEHAIILPGEQYPRDSTWARTAAIIFIACVLAIMGGLWLVFASGDGYVFDAADCRGKIALSRAQTEGARERLKALEEEERLDLLEYRLELLEDQFWRLWKSATKDRLT